MQINWFEMIYTVLGGLGIFFYGMKGMSDGLQAVAGDVIKKVINTLTTNRFFAVIVGTLVTMIVQSSSVTTVMVVGFVNAGLMNLTQAIGVIFGANIGTTITGWIISIKVGKYGLLLIGMGIMPMLFSRRDNWKQIGKILFSIGLIFFGLEIMGGAFKPLRTSPEFSHFITYFAHDTYISYVACIMVGCLLTMVIQSSSAMLGITIALATAGAIEFQTALALVLGENIGTTITAILASIGGNVNARRAARAHAMFNLLGVTVILCLFPFYVHFIEWLVPGVADFTNAAGDRPYVAVHIATGHSAFNLIATLIFLPFVKTLAKVVTKLTPDRELKEQHHLVVLGNPADMLPATALVQVTKEVEKFYNIVGRMFKVTFGYLESSENDSKVLAKIKDYEQITDNIQKEVSVFACSLMERPLTSLESRKAQALVRISSDLESIGDYLEKLAFFKTRFNKEAQLQGDSRSRLLDLYHEIESFFQDVSSSFIAQQLDTSTLLRKSEVLRLTGEDIRERQVDSITKGEFTPLTSLTYADMVDALKKTRGHIHTIVKSMDRMA